MSKAHKLAKFNDYMYSEIYDYKAKLFPLEVGKIGNN